MRDGTVENRRDADAGRNTGASISLARLQDAVARGVISDEQLRMLRALPEPAGGATAADAPALEAPRGLNAVILAYYVGAAAVVFAFGWFIADRWQVLGALGVLAVAVVYAAVFALAARMLARAGFVTAAALATLLTVAMTPLVAWALLDLAGLWYHAGQPGRVPPAAVWIDVLENLRWIPLELATALAALVALRRVHFAVLAIPVAVALPLAVAHLMPLLLDPQIVGEMTAWGTIISAVVVIAAGYVADQRTTDGEDYAGWIYFCGLVTLAIGTIAAWGYAGVERHALPVVAVGLFALALFLRRPMFAVFGGFGFIGYLAYLAFDVFSKTVSFPVLLASFGTCVILVTVLLQRRYPSLARQVEAQQSGRRRVPHAPLVFGGAVIVTLGVFVGRLDGAHDRARAQWTRIRASQLEMHRRQRRAPPNPAANRAPNARP